MTVRALLKQAAEILAKAQVPDAALDSEYLLSYVLHTGRLEMLLNERENEVPAALAGTFYELLERRRDREPLQYIIGDQYFYGLRFEVDPSVLIPRADTETVCEAAIRLLPENGTLLDLCTGCGCIAVAVCHERPDASVYASDISPEALSVARRNNGLNHTCVTFRQGDLFTPWQGMRFDVIVSNPPYIPEPELRDLQPEVLREPAVALNGGPDGADIYRRIIREAPDLLCPDGALCLEAGDGEAGIIRELMQKHFEKISVLNDLHGLPRAVTGKVISK